MFWANILSVKPIYNAFVVIFPVYNLLVTSIACFVPQKRYRENALNRMTDIIVSQVAPTDSHYPLAQSMPHTHG